MSSTVSARRKAEPLGHGVQHTGAGPMRRFGRVGPTLERVNIVLPVVLGPLGVVLAAVGILGLQGKLRRNRFVGVRTGAALRDEDTFQLANRVAGLPNLVAGLVALGAGLGTFLVPAAAVTVGVIGLVGALAIAVAGGVIGHRAAEALPVPEAPKGCGGCACGGGGCSPLAGL